VSRRTLRRIAFSVSVGAAIFCAGFRITSEPLPILFVSMIAAATIGFANKRRPWLWGAAVGLGTRIGGAFEPPLSPDHVSRYGRAQPLPLPFGLTDDRAAQYLAGSLVIMSFPFIAAFLGWALRRLSSKLRWI
jgi:hypothetical protein